LEQRCGSPVHPPESAQDAIYKWKWALLLTRRKSARQAQSADLGEGHESL